MNVCLTDGISARYGRFIAVELDEEFCSVCSFAVLDPRVGHSMDVLKGESRDNATTIRRDYRKIDELPCSPGPDLHLGWRVHIPVCVGFCVVNSVFCSLCSQRVATSSPSSER